MKANLKTAVVEEEFFQPSTKSMLTYPSVRSFQTKDAYDWLERPPNTNRKLKWRHQEKTAKQKPCLCIHYFFAEKKKKGGPVSSPGEAEI